MGKQTVQQSAHRYSNKKQCASIDCDWAAHVGQYCGKCKKELAALNLLKEAEKNRR